MSRETKSANVSVSVLSRIEELQNNYLVVKPRTMGR